MKNNTNNNMKNLVLTAMFSAGILVTTAFLKIPIAVGGYINLGDAVIIVAGAMLNPIYAFFAGAVGSSLADFISGYPIYAPITFIIKGVMAVVVSLMVKEITKKKMLLPSIISELIMIVGYFLFELFVFGIVYSASAVPLNFIQSLASVIFAVFLAPAVSKYNKKH